MWRWHIKIDIHFCWFFFWFVVLCCVFLMKIESFLSMSFIPSQQKWMVCCNRYRAVCALQCRFANDSLSWWWCLFICLFVPPAPPPSPYHSFRPTKWIFIRIHMAFVAHLQNPTVCVSHIRYGYAMCNVQALCTKKGVFDVKRGRHMFVNMNNENLF